MSKKKLTEGQQRAWLKVRLENMARRCVARTNTLSRQYRHKIEDLSDDVRQLLIELNERIKSL